MPFKITDIYTSADVGLIVTGESLEELFIDSAMGLTEIIVNSEGLEDDRTISLEINAENIEDLYFSWLSDIVYYKDAESFLLKRPILELFDAEKSSLKAILHGDTIDPARHILKADIKGVTLYKLKIRKTGNIWRSEVVFDL